MILDLGAPELALLTTIVGADPAKQANWCIQVIKKALSQQPIPVIVREFDNDFWPNYPRKQDRGHARSAYINARKKADAGVIMRGLHAYSLAVHGKEPKFVCLAATWLNGERWTDEYKSEELPSSTAAKIDPHYAIKKQIEHYLKTGRWIFQGQPPDQHWPAFLPKSILDPYREAFKAKGKTLPV